MAIHAIVLLIAFILFLITKNINILALSAAISFAALFVWKGFIVKRLSFIIMPANLITSFRLVSLLLIVLYLPQLSDLWIGGIALGILLLDGVDGFLARKFKTVSDFGAYLDMETDAFYVLIFSCILYYQEKTGWWILCIGVLRYLYFVTLLFFKPKGQNESRDSFAQVIAVVLMASLISGFWFPEYLYLPTLIISGSLVCFSFGKSFSGYLLDL